MKLEITLLYGLFGACLVACLLAVGSMLVSRTPAAVAAARAPAAPAVHMAA